MARTEEETRRLFDEWARSYDADLQNERGPLIGYQRSMTIIADALALPPGALVLDIGIGSGAIASRFEQGGAHIVGIDISPQMLAICREQHPDYELHVGTFNEIPTPDAHFDAVVSGFAYHETPVSRREHACAQMARVLKPGGYLCMLDIMFASAAAMAEARALLAQTWDPNEDYALIGDLDTDIRGAGFISVSWQQTAPFHWMVIARKG